MISPLKRILLPALVACGAALPATAAEEAELWPIWEQSFEGGNQVILHNDWNAILRKYVINQGDRTLFAYGRVSGEDKQRLQRYIDTMAGQSIENYNKDEQLAYWLNLHNALVVDLILREYPVETIEDIGGTFFSPGPWKSDIISVNGETLTLNDIMHRILRPIWGLSVHYGLNHGAKGSPDLLQQAFTGRNVRRLLQTNGERFLEHPRGVSIGDGNRLTVSELYDWYRKDFGGGGLDKFLILHYKQFASRARSVQLESAFGIDEYEFDWSLNDAN